MNNIEMSDRLRMVIDYTGWTDSVFAKKMNVKKGQVSDWVNGRAPMSVKRIIRMLEIVPLIDGDWFMTGEGNMLKEGATKKFWMRLAAKIRIVSS